MHFAQATLAAAIELDIPVPGDFGLMCIGDESWYEVYCPPLTAVSQPVDEIGCAAVERLIALVEGGDHPEQDALFSPTVIARRSCGETR